MGQLVWAPPAPPCSPPKPLVPLDVSADETFERWCAQPVRDTRTLSEFAAAGGRPLDAGIQPPSPWPRA